MLVERPSFDAETSANVIMLHTIGLDSWPILNTDDAVTSFAICNLPSDRFHRGRVHTVGEGHRSLPLRRLDVEHGSTLDMLFIEQIFQNSVLFNLLRVIHMWHLFHILTVF